MTQYSIIIIVSTDQISPHLKVIPDPNALVDPETGLPMDPSVVPGADNINGASGKVPLDGKTPEVNGKVAEPPSIRMK